MRRLRGSLNAMAVVAVVGGLGAAFGSGVGLQAANGQRDAARAAQAPAAGAPVRVQQTPASTAASAPPSAAILKQYCVGCHNDRMKGNFGNLSLEGIDPGAVP